MRCWVYAARGPRVVALIVSASVLGSCISQLGDLRADGDAGGAERGELAKPTPAPRATSSSREVPDAGVISGAAGSEGSAVASREVTTGVPSLDGGKSGGERSGSTSELGESGDRASSDTAGSSGPIGSPSSESTSAPRGCPLGTASSDGNPDACLACESGGYCPGGDAPFTACGTGTYDADLDAKTPCVAQRQCPAGSYVASEGDRVTDRSCADCAEDAYSATPNAAQCQPWSVCVAPNDFELEPPSASSDRQCQACPPLTVSLEANAEDCAALAYVMTAGLVAFEAEHPHVVTNTESDGWFVLDAPQLSGGKCLEVGPDDRSDWTSEPFTTAPRLDYLVQFDAAGTYYVHVRGDAGANSEGLSDSCYAALDGVVTDWYRFGVVGETWGWASKPVVADSAGLHIVSLLAREDGFRVDKIVVSSSEASPTGSGPAESPTTPIVP